MSGSASSLRSPRPGSVAHGYVGTTSLRQTRGRWQAHSVEIWCDAIGRVAESGVVRRGFVKLLPGWRAGRAPVRSIAWVRRFVVEPGG